MKNWRERNGAEEKPAECPNGAFAPFSPYAPAPVVCEWPKPLGDVAFHGPAGQFVRLVEPHTEADPAALLVQFLVAFGSVIGRGPYCRAEGNSHHSNLFAAVVGQTSKGRKGTSWGQVLLRFRQVDEAWAEDHVQSGLSSGEGLIWAVRDPIAGRSPIRSKGRITGYEDVESDPGIRDKRLLVVESELASTLRVTQREGNTLSALIRQAWDTGGLRVLTKTSPAKATGAHISLIGHITRDELRRYLDRTEIGNGFANRFLWICARRSKALPEGGQLDTVNFQDFQARLSQSVDFSKAFGDNVIGRDEEARSHWAEVYENLSEGKPGLFGAVTSRAEAQVLRLSLVYALLDRSSTVNKAHLAAALEVWRYAEESAKFIFGDSLGDPVADEVLAMLRAAPEGIAKAALAGNLVGHHKRDSFAQALTNLAGMGLIASRQIKTGGRPTEYWYALGQGLKGSKGLKAVEDEAQAQALEEATQ